MSAWKAYTGQKIERLYAWIATEKDGGEGLCAMISENGLTIPLIGADMERIESLRDKAQEVARMSRCPVRLVEFSQRRVVEDQP